MAKRRTDKHGQKKKNRQTWPKEEQTNMAKRKRIKQQTMVNKTRYTENYRTNLTENLE
jgi:hypothetical protein